VAALPNAPLAPWTRFFSFLSAKPLKKAARSSGRDPGPDAGGLEVVDRRLRHVDERRVDKVVAGVEAVRVAGLGQELPGAGGIVRVARGLPVEVEARGDDARRHLRVAEVLRLVDRLPVDGMVRGHADPPIVPGRFGIPLVGEKYTQNGGRDHGRLERESRRSPDFLGHRAKERIGDVDFTPRERGEPASCRPEWPGRPGASRSASCASTGRTPPEPARRRVVERHEPIRPGADRRLLEPVLTDLLDVLLRHDPARPGGDRGRRS